MSETVSPLLGQVLPSGQPKVSFEFAVVVGVTPIDSCGTCAARERAASRRWTCETLSQEVRLPR